MKKIYTYRKDCTNNCTRSPSVAISSPEGSKVALIPESKKELCKVQPM